MNILVTGAQGFIGQKISYFLFKKKIHIYGIGRKKLSNSHIKKIGFKKLSMVKSTQKIFQNFQKLILML